MATTNYSKQLGIGNILTEAKNLFFDNLTTYKKIFLMLLLPFAIIQAIIGFIPLAIGIPLMVASLVVYLLGTIALVKQTDKIIEGDKKFNFELLRKESWTYFWKYLALAIIMSVLLILLFALLVIPGIIFSIFWVFAMYVLILKDKSPMDALKYSKMLVKGRWWNVLGYIFVFSLFAVLLTLPFMILSTLTALSPLMIALISSLIYVIGSMIIGVYFSVVQVVYFKNMDAMYGEKSATKKVVVSKAKAPKAKKKASAKKVAKKKK